MAGGGKTFFNFSKKKAKIRGGMASSSEACGRQGNPPRRLSTNNQTPNRGPTTGRPRRHPKHGPGGPAAAAMAGAGHPKVGVRGPNNLGLAAKEGGGRLV